MLLIKMITTERIDCLPQILTIKGEDMLSNASSILFAVWLVTPLLPEAKQMHKKVLSI